MEELPAETVREVESLVTDWLHENDVPGASLVVVDEDQELYAESFGARDLDTNAPATLETLYGMGSITKSHTALAVLQLAEAGKLAVEDPVNDYVDHYMDAPGDPITIGELLSHTSGMPNTPLGLFPQQWEGYPAGIADQADHERFVQNSTAYRVIEKDRFQYYSVGYQVLGQVVEAVDGRTYADYVREEIFEPLGMDRSSFSAEGALDTVEDAMTGYRPGGPDEPPEPAGFVAEALRHPTGGLIASVRDMSVFLRAMMTDGSVDGRRVCEPDTVERLQRGRVTRHTFLDGTDQEVGYGWMRHPLGSDEVIGHAGNTIVSTSYVGYLAAAGYGVVLACNTSADPSTPDLGKAILAVLTDQPITTVPGYALKEKCDKVTGTYESFREEFTVTVDNEGGTLSLSYDTKLGGGEVTVSPTTLDPEDYTFSRVTEEGAREQVEFDLDGDRADLYLPRSRLRRTEQPR